MKKLVLIYDDRNDVPIDIKDVVGCSSFGKMLVKRKTNYDRIKDIKKVMNENVTIEKITKKDIFDTNKNYPDDTIFFHLFSNYIYTNIESFKSLLEKIIKLKETKIVNNANIVGMSFDDKNKYFKFIEKFDSSNISKLKNKNIINTDDFIDLSDFNELIRFLSLNLDTRYFNDLIGDKYTITKKSINKEKIKMEYSYYYLLPEDMQKWMVKPYDYTENENEASYTMKRIGVTDIAFRWTHYTIKPKELEEILKIIFEFFNTRFKKKISKKEYEQTCNELYITKVDDRIKKLKEFKEFKELDKLISATTEFKSIDEIVNLYKSIYKKITAKYNNEIEYYSVIGHGDVFFANMLYEKKINKIRLIDPKGALNEAELWTNPYYDIAKLSHSICGNYDFFNAGLYEINLNENLKNEVKVLFDNKEYVNIFKKYSNDNGYNYYLIRLYEASLFLSMLPLHIDNVHKVFAFILNAIQILEELDTEEDKK